MCTSITSTGQNAHLANEVNEKVIPVAYGYIRVSEADALDKNLRTQEMELFAYGIRQELMFTDDASGGSFDRPGWTALMERVCPGDTVAVAFFDRFARNFYEGVTIQKELAGRRINIVAIREGIDTSDDSAGGKFYRRIMLANGQYWRDTTSERVRSGQKRARGRGQAHRPAARPGCQPGQLGAPHGGRAGKLPVHRARPGQVAHDRHAGGPWDRRLRRMRKRGQQSQHLRGVQHERNPPALQ